MEVTSFVPRFFQSLGDTALQEEFNAHLAAVRNKTCIKNPFFADDEKKRTWKLWYDRYRKAEEVEKNPLLRQTRAERGKQRKAFITRCRPDLATVLAERGRNYSRKYISQNRERLRTTAKRWRKTTEYKKWRGTYTQGTVYAQRMMRYKRSGGHSWNMLRSTAKKRGIALNLNRNEWNILTQSHVCYYCGNPSEFGLDRLDSSGCYDVNNCKSCCAQCNFHKTDMPLNLFLAMMCHIHKFRKDRSHSRPPYVRRARIPRVTTYISNHRNLPCELSVKEIQDLQGSSCFYCGLPACNGIDRVDSSKGYTPCNVVPACFGCNRMKNNYSLEVFYGQCEKINNRWSANIEQSLIG